MPTSQKLSRLAALNLGVQTVIRREVVNMLCVRDIMTKKVYTVDFNASAEEAAWGLTRRQIGAAPVRNVEDELVGMLTKDDLVDPAPEQWIKKEPTVGDLMDPEVVAVYEDDAALVAAHEMATKNMHRLIVVNTEGVGGTSAGFSARAGYPNAR